MNENGTATLETARGIASVTFAHPKGNSLPGTLLRAIAARIDEAGTDPAARVVLLRSEGKNFCGGASFDELLRVDSVAKGEEFFSGFVEVILAMRRCPKFIVARIQGKVVGGGVGVAAAADYAVAADTAAVRLSEIALGIGPFTIGPAVQRRIGTAAFSDLAVLGGWRDAAWAYARGLYAELCAADKLDEAVERSAERLASYSPRATARLKAVLWEGTDDWERLLRARARISSELVLTDEARSAIAAAKG